MAKKKKLTYWQRVYLTLKIRSKKAIRNGVKKLSEYKLSSRAKLTIGTVVLVIVLFFGGKWAWSSYRLSTQTKLGYSKEEASLILENKLQKITKEYGYSQNFVQAVANKTYDDKYTPLYFYIKKVEDTDKLYYDKLKAKEYSQEQLKMIFESMSRENILPLLVYDKQEDLALYLSDVKNSNVGTKYLNFYENTIMQDSLELDGVVNKTYGLSETFVPDELTSISNYCAFNPTKLTSEATSAFYSMCMDAKQEDVYFASMVAYRSYEEQQKRYNSYLEQYGELQVDNYTTRPGFDEHQSGLAVNVASMAKNPQGTAFVNTAEYAWLVEHAAEYGFIFRYPSGKEHITGMEAESTHLRYVGVELAKLLKDENLVLEEYHALYK